MSTPQKLLLVTAESHPTNRPDVAVLFGRELPRQGISCDLVATTSQAPNVSPAWPAGKAYLWRARSTIARNVAEILMNLSLLVMVFRGYSGVVIRDRPILGVVGLLAARLAGIRFHYWMSFPITDSNLDLSRQRDLSLLRRCVLYFKGRVGGLLLFGVLLPKADWVFVQSDAMARDIATRGVQHKRVTAVPMGIDDESLPVVPPGLPEDLVGKQVAIYLGSLDRLRGLEVMIDAAAMVARSVDDFRLLVVGEADEPADRGALARYAQKAGLGEVVKFTGRVPREKALEWAGAAQVGLSPIVPSKLFLVSSPTKPMEYMAVGIPTIGSDLPDQRYVIGAGDCGWCVAHTAEGFAQAILECLSDPVNASAKGRRGRTWVLANRSYSVLGQVVADAVKATRGQAESVRQTA